MGASEARMAQRSGHAESGCLEGICERPAMGHGQPRAGLSQLTPIPDHDDSATAVRARQTAPVMTVAAGAENPCFYGVKKLLRKYLTRMSARP
jgi:hypothetical protein